MNAEIYAQFLKRWGYKVIRTTSCYWYDAGRYFYQGFPLHRILDPSDDEIRQVLWRGPAIGLRFTSNPEAAGRDSYLIICDDPGYDLSSLHPKARNQTRRGIERCVVDHVDFERLAHEGLAINQDTWQRQGRSVYDRRSNWQLFCNIAATLPGFEAWGAFVDGQLVAYLVTFQMEECCNIVWHMSKTNYLSYYPNNALVFHVTREMISRPDVTMVSYGLQSLDAPPSVDHFKLRMGYRKKHVKQCIVINPLLAPLILNRVVYRVLQGISARRPSSDFWRKVAGVLKIVNRG